MCQEIYILKREILILKIILKHYLSLETSEVNKKNQGTKERVKR